MPDHEPGLLVVWDSPEQPPDGVRCAMWDGYHEDKLRTSVLQKIERDGPRLREKCLDWFEGLGELQIGGQRLTDRLLLEPGLSYWPMTRVAELNYWASRAFLDVLRLLVLEELLDEQQPRRIRLVTENRSLGQAIAGLCRIRGVQLEWSSPVTRIPRLRRRMDIGKRTISTIFRTGRWLLHIWPLWHSPPVVWQDHPRSIFFCTYNLATPMDEDMEVQAYSRYWGGLPALLVDFGRPLNWLHIYQPTQSRRARRAVDSAIARTVGIESHAFMQAWLSVPLLFDTLRRWRRLRLAARAVDTRSVELADGDRSWLWSVIDDDWQESIHGTVAVGNLVSVGLFDRALSEIPRQETGIYLFENQPWEPAFIHAWKKHGHGRVIGVGHTATRFWDLRYYRNRQAETTGCPAADLIVLNGPAMVSAMIDAGVDPSRIVEAEALRLRHLSHSGLTALPNRPADSTLRLLVLTDNDPLSTIRLLELLESAISGLTRPIATTLRSHPNSPVDPSEFPGLRFELTSVPMVEALQNSDLVLGGGTSALTESFLLGRRTVVALDRGLNFSPLRSVAGVDLVVNADDLRSVLRTCDVGVVAPQFAGSLFHLDERLPRWSQLLDLEGGQSL